jgi:DNA-binding CsgD family transcriptional regulator
MAASKDEQKQTVLIVLQAAGYLQSGKSKLASFLHGSHSKVMRDGELDKKMGYGALFWQDIPTIKGFIDQLLEIGLIKSRFVEAEEYSYPIIILTDAGRKVLADRIEIPLQIRKETKSISIGDTEKETLNLFKNGLTPQQIAEKRALSVSTIFTHLQKLISVGEVSAKQCVPEEVINKVLEAKKCLRKDFSLKELKEKLPDITYDEIKVALGDIKFNEKES